MKNSSGFKEVLASVISVCVKCRGIHMLKGVVAMGDFDIYVQDVLN